jgi:AhpD family alkylhydroperoxidase
MFPFPVKSRKERTMTREKIYEEMREILGQVPGFFKNIPDDCIESEWELFKRFELGDTPIPPKYRELIGVAVAAAQHCWYCTNFHSALARFHGADESEVQEASLLAKFGSGWSTYLNGTLYDRERFLKELEEVGQHLMSKH